MRLSEAVERQGPEPGSAISDSPSFGDLPPLSPPLAGPHPCSCAPLAPRGVECAKSCTRYGPWVRDYLIFDIATVRYRFSANRDSVTALAPTGELLAVVELAPHHSEREAAFLAADAALRSARVLRDGLRCKVAFYNPYTADICLQPVPETRIFSDLQPLAFEPAGQRCSLEDDGLHLFLADSTRRIVPEVRPSLATTSRRLATQHEVFDARR